MGCRVSVFPPRHGRREMRLQAVDVVQHSMSWPRVAALRGAAQADSPMAGQQGPVEAHVVCGGPHEPEPRQRVRHHNDRHRDVLRPELKKKQAREEVYLQVQPPGVRAERSDCRGGKGGAGGPRGQ